MDLTTREMLAALKMVGELLDWPGQVEILLAGGVAGMVTGVLKPERTTGDCDMADCSPAAAAQAVESAARAVALRKRLPENWLNDQVGQLSALPDGWRSRRHHVATFNKLKVYAVSALDLLAMKVFAHRDTDRKDIAEMQVGPEEIAFIRKYLAMLTIPSRRADLDQVREAQKYLESLEGGKA